MGRQTVGVHFESSFGKKHISHGIGVYFRASGGEYWLQCETLSPDSEAEEEAIEKNQKIQEPVLVRMI